MLHSILGPNGAGKTTLFNLLTRDLPVSGGEILLRGEKITGLKPHQIARRGVGRSYQISSVYLDLSFHQNVWLAAYRKEKNGGTGFWRSVGSYKKIGETAARLLDTLGLAEFSDVPAKATSYGDQRLLEIAVTLATDPRDFVAGRANCRLVAKGNRTDQNFIQSIKSKYTIIMIEHKMNVVMEFPTGFT